MALPSASAHVLGIKPGEAVVIRNIGGRITPDSVDSSCVKLLYSSVTKDI